MPLSHSILTGITLTAFSGNPPNVIIHGRQTISRESLNLGKNSIKITHDGIKSALAGVYATGTGSVGNSLQLEYSNGISVVDIEGTPYSITYYPYYSGLPSTIFIQYSYISFNAFMYMGGTSNSYETIVNNIITATQSVATIIPNASNAYPGPSVSTLTQNISWAPNRSSNNWYNYSSSTEDYISQQAIIYAAIFSYIATRGKYTQPAGGYVPLSVWTNANNSGPQSVCTIQFMVSWPFVLVDNLYLEDNSNTTFIAYDQNGSNLPPGMSGLTTLNESDMLTIFKVNMADVYIL
jgi:hypothetical protein